jgi:hypothetical protein
LQQSKNLLHRGFFLLELLDLKTLTSSPRQLLVVLERLLGELDVFDAQLLADDGKITNWVDIAFNVNNFGIIETSDYLEDSIDCSDVG